MGADRSVTNRLISWLQDLLDSHSPANTPAVTPIGGQCSNSFTVRPEPNVLVVTHEECLSALMKLFSTPVRGEPNDTPTSPVEVHLPPELPVVGYFPNTAFSVLQVGWEDVEGSLVPRGTVECWGVADHLA